MANLRDIHVSPRQSLPCALLSVRFSRSGGPGGQHVNRTASKADVRLDLDAAQAYLGEATVLRLRQRLNPRLDGQGNLQVVCDEHREQGRNVDTAIERMEALLQAALKQPKKRRPTKPSRGAKERRLEGKRQRSITKKQRSEY